MSDDHNRPNDNETKKTSSGIDIAGARPGTLIPGVTDASPPTFVSLEDINKAANGITNMALAHEIAVDESFRLEKLQPPKTSLESQVKENLHNAFWVILRSQLSEDPPNYTQALTLLEDIKQKLSACLLSYHERIKVEIEEVLDSEVIQQQVQNSTLDFQYYANFVISMMAKLCAPIRDEGMKELAKETDTVNVFRKILEMLDLMQLDMANFTISVFRTDIMMKSIEYEKKKFEQFIQLQKANGTDGLEFTRDWILRHCNASSDTSSSAPKKLPELLGECYLELLNWSDEFEYPETCLMDKGRFTELGEVCQRIAISGAVVLMSLSTCGAVLQSNAEAKEVIKRHTMVLLEECKPFSKLGEVMPNIAEQAIKDTNDAMVKAGHGVFNGEKQSLLYHNITEAVNPKHRIRSLIYQRLMEFLMNLITTRESKTDEIRVPPGLSSLSKEIAVLSGKFLRLVSHNREVFGEYYYDIYKTSSQVVSSGSSAAE